MKRGETRWNKGNKETEGKSKKWIRKIDLAIYEIFEMYSKDLRVRDNSKVCTECISYWNCIDKMSKIQVGRKWLKYKGLERKKEGKSIKGKRPEEIVED